jgi:sugar phosphate isomerase/epimerase
LFDLKQAAASRTYCDEISGTLAQHGLQITELSTHLQGQLVAVHPAYDTGFDGFAAPEVRGDPVQRQKWAVEQMKLAATASANLGLTAHATFSGALAWPYLYSWPPRPPGLIEEAFDELARRWRPILDAFDHAGVDVCYEIHPGEDLHDGETYEMFLDRLNGHKRACLLYDPSHFVLQQLNYLDYIDCFHDRIKIFHVKDAEFNPTGKQGVYGGFQPWLKRAGRFRSLGDGQVDFAAIFSKMAAYDFPGWAVLEWECCIKHPEDGAREGAAFIREHIIRVAERAFDDFAGNPVDKGANKKILGIH